MTMINQFKTNLRCGSCVAAIKPYLDSHPRLERWDVDVASPEKTLTVEGDVTEEEVQMAVAKGGYQLLGKVERKSTATPKEHDTQAIEGTTYYPLILLMAFLLGVVAFAELRAGSFQWERAMANFMGAFFLAFSFFKLLDLRGFADSYRSYDVVAKWVPAYAFAYPFVELLLGIAYITDFQPRVTNGLTLVVMSVSSIGVVQSLLAKKKIRCACLGTVFNLPMSTVTLVEDGLMVAMAATALFVGGH